ncbi:MAG: endonuclease III domain-containing protein [Planctomycetota bacterium]|nr:MAG: endonuclease III domain-containing protein [Planctomycetota bacterium]
MAKTKTRKNVLMKFYRALFARFGHRDWWPGSTPFEVMVGAVLTQNTNWSNVEKAIHNLKKARKLTPHAINRLSERGLARLIRPSGYFNVKAKRLKSLVRWFVGEYRGKIENFSGVPTKKLREELLGVYGIGEETADSILCYALERKSFVVDAYTRRVLYRHRLIKGKESYGEIKELFESSLPKSLPLYNDFHAQIVAVGHRYCTPRKPKCEKCPLNSFPVRKVK